MAQGAESKGAMVDVSSEFSGGNVAVTTNEGAAVTFGAEPRAEKGGAYWYFAATANEPGTVTFTTTLGGIGFQGPAISTDGGKTWKWLGLDQVTEASFSHDFAKKGDTVRFSSSIPYVQANLDAFVKENAGNPNLKTSVLTKSGKGRDVTLLKIGNEGPGVRPMLVTGRQHANESVSSYVLEGFLRAAVSNDPAGVEFRKKYVLYAVPLTDTDGVELGDQGKNRKPHDHNRDWTDKPIHAEVIALMELDKEKNFKFALDFHCPTMRMDIHQRMYFAGQQAPPANNLAYMEEFGRLIKEGMPKGAPGGPAMMASAPITETTAPKPMFSRYFGAKPGVVFVCTLEFPFSPPKAEMNPPALLEYGKVIQDAWTKMVFTE